MIQLWELKGEADCRYSSFAWRTKLALMHKGLSFEACPVSVRDKDAIKFSGQGKVPIILHDNQVVSDSWSIAVYLERTFPERPSLFGGPIGMNMSQFFNLWTDRELVPAIVPPLMLDVLKCVDSADAQHHRSQMEPIFKRTLEELHNERGKSIEQFRRKVSPVRRILAETPFLVGEQPAYPDYILFSVLQWCRIVSVEIILAPDDAVAAWFERMLDLFGSYGRRERSSLDRMSEAAA